MLEAARKSNRNTDVKSEDYKRLQIVVNTISRYLQIYDLDNGTVHSQVFTMLYTSDKYYTYNQICNTAHISKKIRLSDTLQNTNNWRCAYPIS